MNRPRMRTLAPPLSWVVRTLGSSRLLGGRQSLVILMFHRVLAERDAMLPDEPDVDDFAARMNVLADVFNVLPLQEAYQLLRAGALPPRAACITFDDGYRNNLETALPVLQARGLPATVFVAPGYADGRAMFNDVVIEAIRTAPCELDLADLDLGRHSLSDMPGRARAANEIIGKLKYLPQDTRSQRASVIAERAGLETMPRLMMNATELRQLRDAGIEIGAHTVWHPILRQVSIDDARREIMSSKQQLEEVLSEKVRSFAYPNGKPGTDYGPEHVDLVQQAGFDVAVSTAWGAATTASNPLELPRIAPWDLTALRYAARVLSAARDVKVTKA